MSQIGARLRSDGALGKGVKAHDRLPGRVWSPGNLRVLHTHLKHLHRKLGDAAANPKYIFAEPRVGCRMPKGETADGEPSATP